VMLLLTTWPILKFDDRQTVVQRPTNKVFVFLCSITIIVSVLQIYTVFSTFNEGLIAMLADTDQGAELYRESMKNNEDSGVGISNIASIINGAFSNLSVLFLFYSFTLPKRNKYLITGLIIAVVINVMGGVSSGQRTDVVLKCLTILFTYFLMRNFMHSTVRKYVRMAMVVILICIAVPVLLITIGRFSSTNKVDDHTFYSLEWYYGQSFLFFNNYGLDADGIRYGDRTANLFKQIIWDDTPHNYMERRDKYPHLKIDDYYFYTFIGDFTIDYGPIVGTLILVFFSFWFVWGTREREGELLFHQLILLFFVVCVCAQGTTYLFSFSDVSGGINLITFLLTYCYFKLDYLVQNKLITF
jgi:oligosaccharide repeat unit polymerase